MALKKNTEITTIKLYKETKLRIEKLREHRRESYDEILRKMLGILSMARTEPEKARMILNRVHKPVISADKYTQVYPQRAVEKKQIPEKKFKIELNNEKRQN
jgi:hypothetical protein